MAKSNTDNVRISDPNRFRIAKQMPVVPGGAMNNNPMNVTSIGVQGAGMYQTPYMDMSMNPASMGGVFPMNPSGKPQSMTSGTGWNQMPLGTVPTPDPQTASMMNAQYAFTDAQNRGLFASALGITGMPGQQLPGSSQMGGVDQAMNSMTMALQGVQSAEVPNMVPGSTPQKKGKGKKRSKA